MDTGESVRITLRSIRAHKLRSALTVVGVVIGIASVITFATFGASVEAEIVGDIETSNAGNIYVFGTPSGDDDFDRTLQPVFTEYDVQQLEGIQGVQAVLPRGIVQTQSIQHGNRTLARQQVTATRPASITDGVLVEGRSFEADEEAVVVNERMAGSFSENLTTGERLTMTMPDGASAMLLSSASSTGPAAKSRSASSPASRGCTSPLTRSTTRSSRARRRACGSARTRR